MNWNNFHQSHPPFITHRLNKFQQFSQRRVIQPSKFEEILDNKTPLVLKDGNGHSPIHGEVNVFF